MLSLLSISVPVAASASLLSGWIAMRSRGANGLPGCTTGSACDKVTRGRWAKLGSFSVAGIGSIVYAALGIGAIVVEQSASMTAESARMHFLEITSFIVIGGGIWFVAIQAFVLRRFCLYCLAVHILASVAAILILRWLSNSQPVAAGDIVIATTLTCLFAIGQTVLKPKTFLISTPNQDILQNDAAVLASHRAQDPLPNISSRDEPVSSTAFPLDHQNINRTIRLYGNKVLLNLAEWPTLGSPTAPNVLAVFVDFTCKECHHLHQLLSKAVSHYEGRLSFVIIPVPLHRDCNTSVTCYKPEQSFACAFARLAWALWYTDRKSYQKWDQFLAESDEPTPFGIAMDRAKELCDLAGFSIQESDVRLDSRIADGVKLSLVPGKAKVPAVLMQRGILHGHIQDLAAFTALLDPQLSRDFDPRLKEGTGLR